MLGTKGHCVCSNGACTDLRFQGTAATHTCTHDTCTHTHTHTHTHDEGMHSLNTLAQTRVFYLSTVSCCECHTGPVLLFYCGCLYITFYYVVLIHGCHLSQDPHLGGISWSKKDETNRKCKLNDSSNILKYNLEMLNLSIYMLWQTLLVFQMKYSTFYSTSLINSYSCCLSD